MEDRIHFLVRSDYISEIQHPDYFGSEIQNWVNVDFPIWMVEMLDKEAKRLGVTRQSIIKICLAERLERIGRPAYSPQNTSLATYVHSTSSLHWRSPQPAEKP